MSSSNRGSRARLFWNGRSQAVRLPKEFRFDGDEVEIRRDGDAVILEPVKKRGWPPGYWEWASRAGEELDLGEIVPVASRLFEVSLDDE